MVGSSSSPTLVCGVVEWNFVIGELFRRPAEDVEAADAVDTLLPVVVTPGTRGKVAVLVVMCGLVVRNFVVGALFLRPAVEVEAADAVDTLLPVAATPGSLSAPGGAVG